MARALSKPHLRVVGVDDGAFTRRHRYAPLVGVVLSVPGTVEGVLVDRVAVDGIDGTERIRALVAGSPHQPGVRALLLDGVAVGGFNIVDLGALARRLGIPVVALTRRRPDLARIRAALWKYFPKDRRSRWARLRRYPLFRVPTTGQPLWAACAGCTRAEAREIVRRTTIRGFWPEPLRLAHLIGHVLGDRRRRTLKPRAAVRRGGGPVA